MVKVWTSVALAVFGLGMVGWNTIQPGDSTRLVVTGSSTVAPLAAEISRLYEAQHPADRVDVQTGGSSRGIADARQGLADVGMVSRSPKDGEDDLIWYPIARDGICLIAHRDNPLTSLTDDQVVAIYRGDVSNWRELGGPDAEITVVNKAEGRSTLEVFLLRSTKRRGPGRCGGRRQPTGHQDRCGQPPRNRLCVDRHRGVRSTARHADPSAGGERDHRLGRKSGERDLSHRAHPPSRYPGRAHAAGAGVHCDVPLGRSAWLDPGAVLCPAGGLTRSSTGCSAAWRRSREALSS